MRQFFLGALVIDFRSILIFDEGCETDPEIAGCRRHMTRFIFVHKMRRSFTTADLDKVLDNTYVNKCFTGANDLKEKLFSPSISTQNGAFSYV